MVLKLQKKVLVEEMRVLTHPVMTDGVAMPGEPDTTFNKNFQTADQSLHYTALDPTGAAFQRETGVNTEV